MEFISKVNPFKKISRLSGKRRDKSTQRGNREDHGNAHSNGAGNQATTFTEANFVPYSQDLVWNENKLYQQKSSSEKKRYSFFWPPSNAKRSHSHPGNEPRPDNNSAEERGALVLGQSADTRGLSNGEGRAESGESKGWYIGEERIPSGASEWPLSNETKPHSNDLPSNKEYSFNVSKDTKLTFYAHYDNAAFQDYHSNQKQRSCSQQQPNRDHPGNQQKRDYDWPGNSQQTQGQASSQRRSHEFPDIQTRGQEYDPGNREHGNQHRILTHSKTFPSNVKLRSQGNHELLVTKGKEKRRSIIASVSAKSLGRSFSQVDVGCGDVRYACTCGEMR